MSIEKDLSRIATALETIAGKLDHIGQAVDVKKPQTPVVGTATAPVSSTVTSANVTASQAPEAPKQPPVTPPSPEPVAGGASTPVTTAPVAVVPPSPPAEPATLAPTTQPTISSLAVAASVPTPSVVMTPEQLNEALVAEFQRLGSREPIDTVMRAAPFNAQSITDLSAEQYAPLIAAVQAVAKV